MRQSVKSFLDVEINCIHRDGMLISLNYRIDEYKQLLQRGSHLINLNSIGKRDLLTKLMILL